ncbi:MAG: KUP/HAK/KT family potassium transporter [Thermonemataceae bacterium]|nr:KUP/HAK/KT family potassium transporter [Thermonemataceae bacterium]
MSQDHNNLHKLSAAGLLVTLGIIFGDIGTSPLYVMKAIIGEKADGRGIITQDLVYGGISAVFWTLTLQTTLKYVILTLRADNKGEGGIFSLYTLVRRRSKWLIVVAMIGGAMLLADGIITPPISVVSAVEGLRQIYPSIKTSEIIWIASFIIMFIFFFQRFGTAAVGKGFGPIMFVWFSMLGFLGLIHIVAHPEILKAINPYYAYNMVINSSEGFWILGAVFLCTTGAEALYSDLGHCGRSNIRISWIFVKTMLVLNYLGQGAWLMQYEGKALSTNPFYGVMPQSFVIIGVIIATLAAIIASQALISGSFTLVSEAIRLNLFPKLKINYPSKFKGQLYIPSVNAFLMIGCLGVVWWFEESSKMEAAYGLAITTTMLMTTLLLAYYLKMTKVNKFLIALTLSVYILLETAFFVANAVKFSHGGYITILIASLIVFAMWVRYKAVDVKRRLTDYVKITDYLEQLMALSKDTTIPKFATHLVFLSTIRSDDKVEQKVIYSILQKQPKRADLYWFVHIEVTDEPYTMEYKTKIIAPDDVIKVEFRLGFRVEQKVSLFLRLVIQEMVRNGEIDVRSRYHSLKGRNVIGDFRFVILEEVLSSDNDLPFLERFVLNADINIKSFTASPEKWFGLDTSLVTIEKVPLVINPVKDVQLARIYD